MARIKITFTASPWRNGKDRSVRVWRPNGAATSDECAATVNRSVSGWMWWAYLPGLDGTSRWGTVEVPAGADPAAARLEAKRCADEALRKLTT